MKHYPARYLKKSYIILTGVCLVFLALAAVSRAQGLRAHHNIEVELFPAAGKLTGIDEVAIKSAADRILEFHIAERASQLKVTVNKKPRSFDFENGRLKLTLEPWEQSSDLLVTIYYAAIFDDPVPVRPLNADNPGYGVTGTISEKGSFLLAGAGWYPELADSQATYRLKVKAPEGLIAVTAGRSLGHKTDGKHTVSTWEVGYAGQGLSLSVGRYVVAEKSVGPVTAATYLLPSNQDLAQSYLEATAGYLELFSDLFGPYPFQKFAVVENFFPTGFGFPSYTLWGAGFCGCRLLSTPVWVTKLRTAGGETGSW